MDLTDLIDKFDPEVIQAKWVLGGISPEVMPDLAIKALELGFNGSGLQQLAGIVKPTCADLENLPDRAFADLGLKPLDKDQAVTLLIAHGIPPVSATLAVLVNAFPQFNSRWREHIANWGGEPPGSYNDMAQFVHFVIEDLYEKKMTSEVARVFDLLETLLIDADQESTDLIGFGFFEKLQNFTSWKPYGNKVFEPYIGRRSMEIWRYLQKIWAGKSSLADVIRAERLE
jgi:hypothetical protein